MRRRPSVSDEALGEWSESDIWRPAWSAAKRPESTLNGHWWCKNQDFCTSDFGSKIRGF